MNIFAKKSAQTFKQIILIIAPVFALLTYFYFRLYQKMDLAIGALIHKIKTTCDCSQMALFSMHPVIMGALGILSLTFLAFFSYAIYNFVKLIVQTKRFIKQYLAFKKIGHSARLKRVVADLNFPKNRFVEINHASLVVFCYGLIRPKICLSSGLIHTLDQKELAAVLLHEFRHLTAKEPLKLFLIKFFQSTFFFLPGLEVLAKKYFTFSELAADELATNNFTNKIKLARAIFKISQKEEKITVNNGLALSFFGSVIEERVNCLADDGYMPKFGIFSKSFLLGLLGAILAPLFVLTFLTDSSKVFAMHDYKSCSMKEQIASCESGDASNVCSQAVFSEPNITCPEH